MLRRRADWGGQDWRDVETGIDTLVARGLADPKRLGVYGRSYGGYLSAWAVTQTTRFDAACAIAASVDLAAHYGQSDIQRYRAWEFQGAPWENPDAWKRSSPMTFVDRIRTPTLVIAFDEDRRVPAAQGYQFYRALLGRGVPTQFVHYPREPHVPREMRHKADQYQRVRAWFERWVR
jgi:dipeptidyl aminopeptidase/acylaminoacyl peptidase